MKTINKYIITASIVIVSLLTGCSNFDDLNTNPDSTSQVNASMLCTNVILRVTKFSGRDAKAMVNQNALPKYVGYANEGQLSAQYNLIGSSSFEGMNMLPNIIRMLEYAKGSPMEESYNGVAKFTRAMMFYRLTMEMGDIPYQEANKAHDGLYKPKYDSQESVFIAILDELKEASQHFAKGVQFTGDPTPYSGNPDKWRRATNSFTLHVLMSLSKKEDLPSLNIKKRFSDIVAENYLIQKTEDYYGLVYTIQNKHPMYSTNNQFTSRTVISSLLIDNLKKLDDRRLFYFAEPAGAKIAAGINESDPNAYIGVDVSMDYSQMNAGHSNNEYSILNLRYLKEIASEPKMVLTFAEQQLLLAEARIRGWITTGSAKNYYEQGVRSALSTAMTIDSQYAHGKVITQDYIDNYFTADAIFKSTTKEQLEQIWMQKYILNFMQESENSYFDYRRNNYPKFPINSATSLNENNKDGIPMRWLYPGGESSYNRDNLVDALNSQFEGYDEINKIMWLLK